jgi:hypothetical protein
MRTRYCWTAPRKTISSRPHVSTTVFPSAKSESSDQSWGAGQCGLLQAPEMDVSLLFHQPTHGHHANRRPAIRIGLATAGDRGGINPGSIALVAHPANAKIAAAIEIDAAPSATAGNAATEAVACAKARAAIRVSRARRILGVPSSPRDAADSGAESAESRAAFAIGATFDPVNEAGRRGRRDSARGRRGRNRGE